MTDKTRLEAGAQTRLEAEGAGSPQATRIEGPAPVLQQTAALPSALATEYRLVRAFDTLGAEADLFLVERIRDRVQHVLKLYRRGLKPKLDVIEALRACERAHVVETIAYGESDGLWYELLEYGEHGTLREWMNSGQANARSMQTVLTELHAAIQHIHEKKIIHRDLKPENVLLRSKRPLDLVLTDFGISSRSDATQHFTTRSRTIKYGAPEAAAGSVGTSSDYWSLGLMILEGLTGHHPFDGLSDLSIAVQLATAKIDVSGIKDIRWRILCGGLLTRDPKKRWDAELVTKWLAGETPALAADELERPSQKPYKIAKRECWTGAELAIELARNWKEGERHLARGLILPWLREELRDQEAANLLIDINEEKSLKTDDKLVRLIAGLGKGLPPVWRGVSLDSETLIANCRDVITDKAEDTEFIPTLFERRVLEVWGTAGNEECTEWHRLWAQAVNELPGKFDQVRASGGPDKPAPSSDLVLHTALLLVLSKQYRQGLADELTPLQEVLSRCLWIRPSLGDEGIAATLARHHLKAEAEQAGRAEIAAAANLLAEIRRIETDFAETLVEHPALQNDVVQLKSSIAENKASIALTEAYPDIKARIFETARRKVVGASLKGIARWFGVEMIVDALAVAAIFGLGRYWIGEMLTGDGFGFISADLAAQGANQLSAKPYLFVLFIATIAAWLLLRTLARWWGRKLFGK